MFLIDPISQNARSFRIFSELLETLQYETALSYTCGVHLNCKCQSKIIGKF